jgi:DNA polymerase
MYDPTALGAKCDTCPLGPNGWLRRGLKVNKDGDVEEAATMFPPYSPVGPEVHEGALIAVVGAQPGDDETREGRPFVGKSGGELNRGMDAAGLSRVNVSLFNEIACQPPGKVSGAYEMVTGRVDDARRKVKLKSGNDGYSKKEADTIARTKYPHPSECCRPRLINELRPYDRIITLGGTSTSIVNGRRDSILEIAGDPATIEFDGREIRHVPTYHPSFVLRAPGFREEFTNHLGKAKRFFSPEGLNWPPFDVSLAVTPGELKDWFSLNSAAPFITVDCETSRDDCLRARIDLIQFGVNDDLKNNVRASAIAVRFLSIETGEREHSDEVEAEFLAVFKPILEDRNILKVGHNLIGFDNEVFRASWGIRMRGILDTIFLARAVWSDQKKGLKPVGRRLTDVDKWEDATKKPS